MKKDNDKCTIKRKIEIVQNVLDELECIPLARQEAYWEAHMPEVSEEDLELFPEELSEYYKEKLQIRQGRLALAAFGYLLQGIFYLAIAGGAGYFLWILFDTFPTDG